MKISISLFAFLLCVFPFFTASSQNLDADKLARIEKAILGFEEKGFSGTVLIAKGDEAIQNISTGFVDKGQTKPISGHTLFNVASISKGFTALAILKLHDAGLLDLNDPLDKHLPNVPAHASGINIHHLLIHQSGLPNNYASDGEQDMNRAIQKIFSSPLESKPGEKFLYSGNNYSLLAMVIEKVSQSRWEDHIQNEILRPLGMESTIFWYQYHSYNYSKALPKVKMKGKTKKRNYGYVGSTGMFSTAHDLLKLNRAFSDTTFLTSRSLDLLNEGFIKLGEDIPFSKNSYGYGVFIKMLGNRKVVSLRGNEQGWGNAIYYYFKDDALNVIVLSNTEELTTGKPAHVAVSQEIISIVED